MRDDDRRRPVPLDDPQIYHEDQDPTWSGTDTTSVIGMLVKQTADVLNNARDRRADTLRSEERRLSEEIAQLAARLKAAQQSLGKTRADLRALEESPRVTVEEATVAEDVEFITRLPGVLGARIDTNGWLVVHVRTGMDRDGWHYDFGDFEIALSPTGAVNGRQYLRMNCTRSGTYQRRGCYGCTFVCNSCIDVREWTRHLYWSSSSNRDGTGSGSFCFGSRGDEIYRLIQASRCAEAIHVIIDCLNSIEGDASGRFPNAYRRRRLATEEEPAPVLPPVLAITEEREGFLPDSIRAAASRIVGSMFVRSTETTEE